jgi:hypothetical protein
MKIRLGGLSHRQVVRGAACAVLLGLLACLGGTTNAGIFTMPWEQSRGPNPAFASFRSRVSKPSVSSCRQEPTARALRYSLLARKFVTKLRVLLGELGTNVGHGQLQNSRLLT